VANQYIIPLQVGVPQKLSVQLNGVTYQFTILYRNDSVIPQWTLDIADVAGNPLIRGIPLVTGADLLAQYKHIISGGLLVVQPADGTNQTPTFDNLGKDTQLCWVTP